MACTLTSSATPTPPRVTFFPRSHADLVIGYCHIRNDKIGSHAIFLFLFFVFLHWQVQITQRPHLTAAGTWRERTQLAQYHSDRQAKVVGWLETEERLPKDVGLVVVACEGKVAASEVLRALGISL